MSNELMNREEKEAACAERTCDSAVFTPRVDILETDDELLLYADLPGVAPDGLNISYENKELTIEGKVPARHSGVEHLHSEYGVGDFRRTFTIGELIDVESIAAELKHGALTVHLPKSDRVKPRRIEVKTS
jgi:HSP20 family molecular chaperone IbpA